MAFSLLGGKKLEKVEKKVSPTYGMTNIPFLGKIKGEKVSNLNSNR